MLAYILDEIVKACNGFLVHGKPNLNISCGQAWVIQQRFLLLKFMNDSALNWIFVCQAVFWAIKRTLMEVQKKACLGVRQLLLRGREGCFQLFHYTRTMYLR
jgi:hypothetical protein